MKVDIELDEKLLRTLVYNYLRDKLGEAEINPDLITIEVKSKQNYKSEWESAAFRATYSATTL